MSGHTPGPWKVEGAKQEGLSVRADHYGVVCNIPGYGVGAREANARLIAAAPEILQALENLEVAMNTVNYVWDKQPENMWKAMQRVDADLKAARAAIAKAKGEA